MEHIRIFVLILCLISVSVKAEAVSNIQASLISTNEDYASTQGVFASGPGFSGKLLNDYHWTVKLFLDEPKSISSILIEHRVGGEAWTTSSSRKYGKDLYPIVVFKNGEQQNQKYDAKISLPAGETNLELYGQIETHPFKGGNITVEFSDGSSETSAIAETGLNADLKDYELIPLEPNEINPIEPSQLNCQDSDGGANYGVYGVVTYGVEGKTKIYSDQCLSNQLVAEGVCGGLDGQSKQFVISHGVCKNTCMGGACLGGEAESDIEGSFSDVREGWEFNFRTERQRSIEYVVAVMPDGKGMPLPVEYQGQSLPLGNGGNSHIFEPGSYILTIFKEDPTMNLSDSTLWVVFTDGARFSKEI